jgi:hypothetical protein
MNARTSSLSSLALTALLVAGLAGNAAAQTASLAKERVVTIGEKQYKLTSKLKKLLIGSFYYNFNHSTATTNLENTLKRVGLEEGWTVDVVSGTGATGAQSVNAAKLAGYEVFFANFISSWASNTSFPAANRTAVQNFVETQGGGVFIMHSSGDSRSSSNWAWYYSTMMPVTYTGESNRTDVSAKVGINPAAKTHPIMEGIVFPGANGPDSNVWSQGEWHTFSGNITTKVADANILMKMNPATCIRGASTPNCGIATGTYNYSATPGGYSATWTFPAGKGNVGYFMEAHDLVTMNAMGQANWDRFFKQFMYYIAGYDTVEVSTAIGRPTREMLAIDRSGVSFHSKEPGVLITAAGGHVVSLYDLSGRQIKRLVGRKVPADYNFSDFIPRTGKQGVYVVKVNVGKKTMSRRYIL